MPNACWKKTNSPWGKSYDNRGRVCDQNGTVQLVEAGIVLGLLGAILVVLAVGWIVRYSRRASRFRAFWNQSPLHQQLGSTVSFETHELKASPHPRSPSSPSSATLRNSASAESLRQPKYAVPRSTSRPASIVGSSASISSRRSSVSGSAPTVRPISTVHPPVRSSPLATGQPKPSLASRPTAAKSPLAGGSASSEDSERGAFLSSMQSRAHESPLSPPSTYGSGGLNSPSHAQHEFGTWDVQGDGYHPSSAGPLHDAYNGPHSPASHNGFLPQPSYAEPPQGLALRSASPTPSVGQVFVYGSQPQPPPPPPPPPQAPYVQAYRPSTPTRQTYGEVGIAAHSPLERLSFAHPGQPPHPGPPQRIFSNSSDVSAGGFYSPPSSPALNFSRPSSRTDGRR